MNATIQSYRPLSVKYGSCIQPARIHPNSCHQSFFLSTHFGILWVGKKRGKRRLGVGLQMGKLAGPLQLSDSLLWILSTHPYISTEEEAGKEISLTKIYSASASIAQKQSEVLRLHLYKNGVQGWKIQEKWRKRAFKDDKQCVLTRLKRSSLICRLMCFLTHAFSVPFLPSLYPLFPDLLLMSSPLGER